MAALKEWFSAQELVGFPGMPKTVSGVIRWGKKNLATTRKKPRSKAVEYHLLSLPKITQSYIAQHGLCFEPGETAACAEPILAGAPALPVAGEVGGLSTGALQNAQQINPPQIDRSVLATGGAVSLPSAAPGIFLDTRIGMVMNNVQDDGHEARAEEAARRLRIIEPLLKLPAKFPGKRALAEGIARQNGTSVATLYRWIKNYKSGGLPALVDKHRADLGQARVLVSAQFERVMTGLGIKRDQLVELSEWLLQQVRNLWASGAQSPTQVWNQASAMIGLKLIDAGLDAISARAITKINMPRRFIEAESAFSIVATAERDSKSIYDNHLPAVARTREGMLPGDLVFGDISPIDIPVLRPDGTTAYARMIAWMDAATNWIFSSLYLCPPGTGVRQEHVALSFSAMCDESPFGMALRLYLDNGSEYQWEDMLKAWSELAYLTGHETHIEVAAMLPPAGRIIRSIPFRPRGKLIEGAFGNLRHLFGWHPAFQGGNRMAKRCANLGEAIKPIPFDELQSFVAAAMADYHATPQSGQLNGKSPQDALDEHLSRGWRPTRVDREVLLLAFSEQEKRRVRAGVINYAGVEWYADFLAGLNKKLDVRYPKHDPQCLFVFEDGRFLGVALPQQKYGLLDTAGAKEAGRRRGVLRDAIKNMAGQVETIQAADHIGSRAKLLGVDETVERCQAAAKNVELSDEALKLLAAKKAALEQKTEAALIAAAQKTKANEMRRWKNMEDAEMAIWRAKYEDDEEV